MADYQMNTKELADRLGELRAFDTVLLSGTVYTARDAAHKKMFELLDAGKPLPFPVKGSVLYYAGPTQTPPHLPIGSCGPTTSGRMDPYTPRLLELGLCGMIGKGPRDQAVQDAIRQFGGVYFCAIGGAGALACRSICSCEVIAFDELGCESIKRLELRDFPLIVANDTVGGDLFAPKSQD